MERKSGIIDQAKDLNNYANMVRRAIEAILKPLNSRVKNMTVDNGNDFAEHHAIDQRLGIQSDFDDSYRSWQRGSIENFNGLMSQNIPKKRRMKTVSDEKLTMNVNRLDFRQ